MAKIEDQRILIWCNSDETLKQTIPDAVYLAIKLEKEVCLFANYRNETEKDIFHKRLVTYSEIIKKDIPQIDISILLLKGKLHNLVRELGEVYNCIMLCFGGKMNSMLLKAFYKSGFPFYFSRGENRTNNKFKQVIIPVDFRNNTKDATLWGSYLGRFNQSEIMLLQASDNDQELKNKVDSIIAFVKRFYGQFPFNYRITRGNKSSWQIHNEAVEQSTGFDLLIFTGSFNVTLADRIIGTFEKKITNKSVHTSILLINPQQEMYVLCN